MGDRRSHVPSSLRQTSALARDSAPASDAGQVVSLPEDASLEGWIWVQCEHSSKGCVALDISFLVGLSIDTEAARPPNERGLRMPADTALSFRALSTWCMLQPGNASLPAVASAKEDPDYAGHHYHERRPPPSSHCHRR